MRRKAGQTNPPQAPGYTALSLGASGFLAILDPITKTADSSRPLRLVGIQTQTPPEQWRAKRFWRSKLALIQQSGLPSSL